MVVNKNSSLKKLADDLMEIKGNVKGTIIQAHEAFILSKKGEEGVKKVEEKNRGPGASIKI